MELDHYVEKHIFSTRPQAPPPPRVPRDKKAAIVESKRKGLQEQQETLHNSLWATGFTGFVKLSSQKFQWSFLHVEVSYQQKQFTCHKIQLSFFPCYGSQVPKVYLCLQTVYSDKSNEETFHKQIRNVSLCRKFLCFLLLLIQEE